MNQNETLTPVPVQTQIVEVPIWKAISIISGAILVSIVGTAFAVGAVLNSDHFLLANTSARVDALEKSKVDEEIYVIQQKYISDQLVEIKILLRDNKISVVSTPKNVMVTQRPTPVPTAGTSAQLSPQVAPQTANINPAPTSAPQPTTQPTPSPTGVFDIVTGIVNKVL